MVMGNEDKRAAFAVACIMGGIWLMFVSISILTRQWTPILAISGLYAGIFIVAGTIVGLNRFAKRWWP